MLSVTLPHAICSTTTYHILHNVQEVIIHCKLYRFSVMIGVNVSRNVQSGFLKCRVAQRPTPIRHILVHKQQPFRVSVSRDHRRARSLDSEVKRRQSLRLLEIGRGVAEHLRKLFERDVCRFRIQEENDDAGDDTEPEENEVISARDSFEKRGRDESYDKVGHPVRHGR